MYAEEVSEIISSAEVGEGASEGRSSSTLEHDEKSMIVEINVILIRKLFIS